MLAVKNALPKAIVLACLLIAECSAQSMSFTKIVVATGFTNPKVVDGYLLYGDTSQPVFNKTGAIVTIERPKDSKLFDLAAEQIPTLDLGDLVKMDETADADKVTTNYLLVGEGSYRLVAYFSDPPAVKRLKIDLGPPKPPPKPDPEPLPKPDVPTPAPVPSDSFGNIGQRVADWATGMPKKPEVAGLYKACADRLESDPGATVNSAIDRMVADRNKLLTIEEQTQYNAKVIGNINADMKARWPMQQLVLASYFRAIAAGLEGAK